MSPIYIHVFQALLNFEAFEETIEVCFGTFVDWSFSINPNEGPLSMIVFLDGYRKKKMPFLHSQTSIKGFQIDL